MKNVHNYIPSMSPCKKIERGVLVSKCPKCDDHYKNKTDMYFHRLTHTCPNFKNMNCPLCGKAQFSVINLRKHMHDQHNLASKWLCPICPDGRTFTRNTSLLVHIEHFHFTERREAPNRYSHRKNNLISLINMKTY